MKKSGLMSLKSIDLARYGKKNNECHSLTSLIDDPSMKFIVFLRLMLNWSKNLSVFREIPDIIPLETKVCFRVCQSVPYNVVQKVLGSPTLPFAISTQMFH